jgi:tetratricopeptide (TPR) repeat protein
MRAADEHLTPQELESLLFAATDPKVPIAPGGAEPAAKQHLDECAACQQMAKKYVNAETALETLRTWSRRSSQPAPKTPDCPEDEIWLRIAAGLADNAAAAHYVTHAAQCDRCGKLLQESMEDLAQDVTPEEQVAIAQLPSAGEAWQRAMATKLRGARFVAPVASSIPDEIPQRKQLPSRTRKFVLWPRLAFVVSGLAVLIAAGWVLWERTRLPYVERLLNQAYTQRRTLELRIPGAAYAPLRAERGPGLSHHNLPAPLLKAEGIVAAEGPGRREDPAWLQLQARMDLLEWDEEDAFQKLESAGALRPEDPGLLLDRATAWFERASKDGARATADYGQAAEDLTKVLKKNPDDLIALFNRAVLYEKLSMPHEALADLDRYLQLETDQQWVQEARERKKRIEKLIRSHDSSVAEPLADAEAFVELAQGSTTVHLDQRIEEYQDLALRDWLPATFSLETGPEERARLSAALKTLSELLAARHGDYWLRDVLAHTGDTRALRPAFVAMREAVIDSEQGDAIGAYDKAEEAAQFFLKAANEAGLDRAREEQIYALRNAQSGRQCLSEAASLIMGLHSRSYTWIKGQLDVNLASCLLMTSEFDRSKAYILQAEKIARDGSYPTLHLRSIGIAAAIETDEGNIVQAWAADEQGLSEFWSNSFAPPRRAQQFYDDLTYLAEKSREPGLAVTFAGESVRMISLAGDKRLEALSRQHLAKLALRNGDLKLSSEQLARSGHILSALPHTQELVADRLYAEIGLAEVDLRQGNTDRAEQRLNALRSTVNEIGSFTVSRAFFASYGELLVRQHRLGEAESAYRKAVSIADSSLEKLNTSADRYYWAEENSDLYRSLASLKLNEGEIQAALAVWEWYRSAGVGRSPMLPRSLDLFLASDALSPLLSNLKDQTVVTYLLVPTGVAIWVFDERGIHSTFVPVDIGRLSRLAADFSEICADYKSPLSQLRTEGRALFEILVAPVESRLEPGRAIVFEPDEGIRAVPFSALVASDGRYFAETHRSVLSPGVLLELTLRPAGRFSSKDRALVVGSPASFFGPDQVLDPAIDVVEEAKSVSRLFAHSTLLIQDEATAQDMEAALPQARIWHFVGHAISTADHEGLVVPAKRGQSAAKLWGAEAVRGVLFERSQLVVLSACSTGRNFGGAREVHGLLVRSLLLAGVPDVVGSRWNVDARVTTQFMEHFYAALLSGQTVSSSIQAAETAIRGQRETQHPSYWAAFAAYGRA